MFVQYSMDLGETSAAAITLVVEHTEKEKNREEDTTCMLLLQVIYLTLLCNGTTCTIVRTFLDLASPSKEP